MPKSEDSERESKPKKKKSQGGSTLRNVSATAATETLIDLVERLGLVDIVLGRVKARLEETDIDELFDDVADYMRRNPEVLVVTLGGITVATGLLVWLNSRREWDGSTERRGTGQRYTSPGRVRKAS